MRRQVMLVAGLWLSGCRFLAPQTPQVTSAQSALLSNGNPTEPGRQGPLPGNRCGIACAAGFHCDERTATCVADPSSGADGGPAWLP